MTATLLRAGAPVLLKPRLNRLGAHQHRRWNRDAERFRGLQVDDKLELGRSLDRQVCGAGAFEDAVNVVGEPAIRILELRPVREERAAASKDRPAGDDGNTPARRALDDALAMSDR